MHIGAFLWCLTQAYCRPETIEQFSELLLSESGAVSLSEFRMGIGDAPFGFLQVFLQKASADILRVMLDRIDLGRPNSRPTPGRV